MKASELNKKFQEDRFKKTNFGKPTSGVVKPRKDNDTTVGKAVGLIAQEILVKR